MCSGITSKQAEVSIYSVVSCFAVCTSVSAVSVPKPFGTVDGDHVLSAEKTFSKSSSISIEACFNKGQLVGART